MKRQFILVFIPVLAIWLGACTKVEYVSVPSHWEEQEQIRHTGKIILNASMDDNRLLMATEYEIVAMDINHPLVLKPYHPGFGNGLHRFAMKGPLACFMREFEYTAQTGEIAVQYIHDGNDGSSADRFYLNLSHMDTGFKSVYKPKVFFTDELGEFSDDNRFLLPYEDHGSMLKLLLVGFDVETLRTGFYNHILPTDTTILETGVSLDLCPTIVYTHYFFGKFFISAPCRGRDNLILDGANNIRRVPNDLVEFSDMFLLNGVLYALTRDKISFSTDQGETWAILYTGTFDHADMAFRVIDNRAVFYSGSDVYELIMDDEGARARELENEGLEGNLISSLDTYGDKVWVSTLSGLFSVDKAAFFTPKRQ